ncbi:MAG: hypothetical protein ACI9UQ_000871 [Candidatus Krumholzibacteriia bacterium]|jgi:hypothetical protein
MSHPLMRPMHKFHIPVMGTGFTIDTPLKVAQFGINSVVSMVDDVLIEQMRSMLSKNADVPFEAIETGEEDSRARRITAYMDLLDTLVKDQMSKLRESVFEKGSDLTRYFEMLPESPLRNLYDSMKAAADPAERDRLQAQLKEKLRPGSIDVNIMTKLDRDTMRKGKLLPPIFGDAMSALRGYANSSLESSLILSAGLNRRLFTYIADFSDFFPDDNGDIRKRIVLKVGDFRSALVQGKLMARKGLWVSEYRIESGLNCGGHAFGGKGALMGPILDEFKANRTRLFDTLHEIWVKGMADAGYKVPSEKMEFRLTVQGGIGTPEERALLEEKYDVDGTGWASPFLLVPEVVNMDKKHLKKIQEAGPDDVHLSDSSPLGVPFWSLKTSYSEERRLRRIDDGKPGSPCPKGFLSSNTEFTKVPICSASRNFQRRKLASLGEMPAENDRLQQDLEEAVVVKACICHDLAGVATIPNDIDPAALPSICCGPNMVYFTKVSTLAEMVDHIYERHLVPIKEGRPHMFLNEIVLHLDRLKKTLERRREGLSAETEKVTEQTKNNLRDGLAYYVELTGEFAVEKREVFLHRLEELRKEMEALAAEDVTC